MSRIKIIIYAIFLSVIFFLLGFYSKDFLNKKLIISPPVENDVKLSKEYQMGWNDAKTRLEETGYYTDLGIDSIVSLSGKISAINGNSSFNLEVGAISPLADPDLNIRDIKYNSNTLIYKIVKKDNTIFQNELNNYLKKTDAVIEDAPSEFERIVSSESDLRVNLSVNIVADENIVNKKEILVKEITIYYDNN